MYKQVDLPKMDPSCKRDHSICSPGIDDKVLLSMFASLESSISRVSTYDKKTRYTSVLDSVINGLDILSNSARNGNIDVDGPSKAMIQRGCQSLRQELDSLIRWINTANGVNDHGAGCCHPGPLA